MTQILANQQGIAGELTSVVAAINALTAAIKAGDAAEITRLDKIIALLTPPLHFRILIGGKPAMALNIVHDADHETLSIQPMKPDGTPDTLPASVVVTWAVVTDPSATPPSFSLTPNPDNQTAVLKQLGQAVSGCVISATATLPNAAGPETETAMFNIVATADTFSIVFGPETTN